MDYEELFCTIEANEDMRDKDKQGMRQQGKYNKDIRDWTNYRKHVEQEKAIVKRNEALQRANSVVKW